LGARIRDALPGGHATVDEKVGAGRVTAFIGSEEKRGMGDLFGTTRPSSEANRIAAARPMLPPLPVMMQTFPESRPAMLLFLPGTRSDYFGGWNISLLSMNIL
jgi:hypothetical protein